MNTKNNENFLDADQEKSWKEKSTKEKLDLIFVIVAIASFTFSAIVNYKILTRK
jgi:hypothetical protein